MAGNGRAQTLAHKKTALPEGKTRFHGRCWITTDEWVVPPAGIEPARLSALDFESSASTNSATEAASAGAHLSTPDIKMTSRHAMCRCSSV